MGVDSFTEFFVAERSEITPGQPISAIAGINLTIQASMVNDVLVASGTVSYRKVGDTSWTTVPMGLDGDVYNTICRFKYTYF